MVLRVTGILGIWKWSYQRVCKVIWILIAVNQIDLSDVFFELCDLLCSVNGDGNHRRLWNLEFSGATSLGTSRTSDCD